jgi:hypothetical protein
MDATLNPLLSESDFLQEGWRIGPKSLQGLGPDASKKEREASQQLEFKGVVYNEMKGYMSDTNYLYNIRFQEHMAPDLNDSGGDPQKITSLSHQMLRQFHQDHYHPSNSKIYTYGNIPLDEHLQELAQRMEQFDRKQPEDKIVDPIDLSSASREVEIEGPVDPLSPPERQYRTSTSWILNDQDDLVTRFSLALMTDLLMDGYGSPVYRALIESGLGTSFSPNSGSLRVGSKAIFSLGVIGAGKSDVPAIKKVIFDTLSAVHEQGFDANKVDGILHQLEFGVKNKTANFGMSMMQRVLGEWYRGSEPFQALLWQETVDGFKERYAQPGYLEGLLKTSLLDGNTFTFTMKPSTAYAAQALHDEKARMQKKMVEYVLQHDGPEKAQEALIKQEFELQQKQSAEPDLACLPSLSINDVPRVKSLKPITHSEVRGARVQWRNAPTNGITYFRAINPLEGLADELRELLPLFSDCVMRLGTASQTMEQMEQEIRLTTGHVATSYHSSTSPLDISTWEEGFAFSGYAFDGNVDRMFGILRSLILETHFDGPEAEAKIRELVQGSASMALDTISESGNSFATRYALSGLTPELRASEQTGGLSQLLLTIKLSRLTEAGSLRPTIEKLKFIQRLVLSNIRNIRVAITCGPESVLANEQHLLSFLNSLQSPAASGNASPGTADFQPSKDYMTPTAPHPKTLLTLPFQVSYAGLALPGAPYTSRDGAALTILAHALTHGRLHREIREKGGAYGAGASSHGLAGAFAMSSYRDPAPGRSLAVMRDAGRWAAEEWARDAEGARLLDEAKLSVFKGLDAPRHVYQEGMQWFVHGIAPEMAQTRREMLLDVSVEDVRAAAQKFLVEGADGARAMLIADRAPDNLELGWREVSNLAGLAAVSK